MGAYEQKSNGSMASNSKDEVEMQHVQKCDKKHINRLQSYLPVSTNKIVLFTVLVLGLCLYLADVGLHIAIATKYLAMRNCTRNVEHTIVDFRLNKIVDINEVLGDIDSSSALKAKGKTETDVDEVDDTEMGGSDNLAENQTSDTKRKGEEDSKTLPQENLRNLISSKLDEFLTQNVYVKLRDKVLKILPEHWKQRIVDIVTFHVGRHNITSIPDICVVNNHKELTRLSQMALYICESTLENGSVESREGRAIQNALYKLIPSRSEENNLIKAAIDGDYIKILDGILENDKNIDLKRLHQVIDRFQNTFNETGELKIIMGLISDPKISANIGNLTDALGSIDPEHLNGAANALNKLDPKNMVHVEELLGQLNISLATMLLDPGIFFSFLGDPEKGKIFVELQKYLPTFEPRELNDFLTIKVEIDEKIGPDSSEILGKVLSLPMNLLRKIFSLQLADEELSVLKSVANKFLGSSDDDMASLMNFVTKKWQLLTEQGRSNFANSCNMPKLRVACRDASIDLCPNGHLLYGTATACILALPGIIYAISEFLHYRNFCFARVFGKHNSIDRQHHSLLWFLLLPFYMICMIPLVLIATVYHYVKAMLVLTAKKTDEKEPKLNIQEMEIGEDGETKTISDNCNEADDQSLQLHSIQTFSESFLQIVIQIYFSLLLVVMGGSTLIAGRNAEEFFNDIFPLTVASIIISSLSLSLTTWRLHKKELKYLKNYSTGENKVGRYTSFITFEAWFSTEILISIISAVGLCMMTWIELFSEELLTDKVGLGVVKTNVHIIPLLILLLPIPINCLLHAHYVKKQGVFGFAHGVLSAVFPARFLNYQSPSNTKKFILTNQTTWLLSHIAAWFVYGISIYANYIEATGFSKFLPLAVAVITIAPFLGAIHWSSAINPLYNKAERETTLDIKKLDGVQKGLLILWSVFTSITRVASIGLLVYIYNEHWSEVQVVTVNLRLALIETVPYAILLVFGNIGLQFACSKRSFVCGMVSCLFPNGYLGKPHCAGRYILLNCLFNALIHILLFAVLTFYCWECTQELSLSKLMVGFPVAAVLWVLNLASSIIIWLNVLKPIICNNNNNVTVKNIKHNKATKLDNNVILNESLSTDQDDMSNQSSWNSRDSITTPM